LPGGNFSETELRDLLNKLLKTLKRGEVKPIPHIKVSDKSFLQTIFKRIQTPGLNNIILGSLPITFNGKGKIGTKKGF